MAALIERIGEIDLETRLRGAARSGRSRRLRGAAAGDRRPAALDQGGADDLRARPRPVRRQHAVARAAARGRARTTCAAPGSPGRKVEYIRDLASHVIDGELELDRLDELADEEVIEEIVAVRGLGRWTAEMFLIFHLERPDVLSGGDLGIRKAIQIEYGLEEMPTPTSRCWRSASAGARTAASPRSTSGSRSPATSPSAAPARAGSVLVDAEPVCAGTAPSAPSARSGRGRSRPPSACAAGRGRRGRRRGSR